MATKGSQGFSNRSVNGIDLSRYPSADRVGDVAGDSIAQQNANLFFVAVLIFASICLILVPVVAIMLIDVKKTSAEAKAILSEVRKLKDKELKPKKDE